MAQLFANGARAELSAPITNSATSLTVTSGGDVFPNITGSDFFYAVLQDDTGYEIVRCGGHASGTTPNLFSTILRGQFGTTARAFAAGAVFAHRVVAADMDAAIKQRLSTDSSTYTTATPTSATKFAGWLGTALSVFNLGAVVDYIRALAITWTANHIFKTATFSAEYNNGSSGSSKAIAFSNGQKQVVTLTANTTLTLSYPGVGNYILRVVQNATGGYTCALAGGTVRYLGSATAPDINTAANGETIYAVYWNGSVAYVAGQKVGA